MTENRRLLTLYKAYDGGHVIFGSNIKGKVVGGGKITHDSIIITNVEHVSGLAFNLISVGMDKTKITRKPSKTGKHGHGKRKSTREAKDSKPKPEKVKLQGTGCEESVGVHDILTLGLGFEQGGTRVRVYCSVRWGVVSVVGQWWSREGVGGGNVACLSMGVECGGMLRDKCQSKEYIVLNKETMRIEESLNVTFDKSLLEPKSSPLVEDDRINKPIVLDLNGKPSLLVGMSMRRGGHPHPQTCNDSHSNEELYLNDKEDDSDSMVIPQTLSEEIRTRINNARVPPPLTRGIRDNKIWDKIRNPLSPNHIERDYSICCKNTIDMINSIKDLREENMDMFSLLNEAIKLMLVVATNISCVIENNIGKEG
ncbi:hypothetical protein Tco_0964846 [Tanacetum coccineum]